MNRNPLIALSILSADFARSGEEGEAVFLRDASVASRAAEHLDVEVRAVMAHQGSCELKVIA